MPSPPFRGVDSAVTVKSSGATARSWNSRTEKTVRPADELSCLRSASTGTVTAVDDSARASAEHHGAGRRQPEQSRRHADQDRRPGDLQRPEAEDQSPHAGQALEREFQPDHEQQEDDAELGRCRPSRCVSVMASVESTGSARASSPRPKGPSATPAKRKPSTGLTRSRAKSGTTMPAVAEEQQKLACAVRKSLTRHAAPVPEPPHGDRRRRGDTDRSGGPSTPESLPPTTAALWPRVKTGQASGRPQGDAPSSAFRNARRSRQASFLWAGWRSR